MLSMLSVRRYRIILLVAVLVTLTVFYLANSDSDYIPEQLDVIRKVSYDRAKQKDNGQAEGHVHLPDPLQAPEIPVTPKPITNEDMPTLPQKPPEPPRAKGENVVVPGVDAALPTKPNLREDEEKDSSKSGKKNTKGSKTGKASKKGGERYPVAKEDLIKLPTGSPTSLPRIQYAFDPETASEKADRRKKQQIILKSFEHAWGGYKKNAMGCDELKPLSAKCANQTQFMGWGATLVDTLDTLWIMGLTDEFENAVKQVEKIDFTTSTSQKVPLFETVIRYLGGLLSAYDLSEQKYPILLQKATELADVLMGAFDTPNRMPIPYYFWAGTEDPNFQMSSRHTVLAEIGSLSMEFTHLAQLTKKDKYYDAVARITTALEKWQSETRMPGLWPLRLDSSGCKYRAEKPKTKTIEQPLNDHGRSLLTNEKATKDTVVDFQTKDGSKAPQSEEEKLQGPSEHDKVLAIHKPPTNDPDKLDTAKLYEKREVEDPSDLQPRAVSDDDVECEPQALRHELNPPDGKIVFGIGGLADSVYEYMPKMHALLGGRNTQYRSMYEYAMKAIRDGLLFRPMIPDETRSILFAARQEFDAKDKDAKMTIWEGTHLTCFAGGMVGLASKMFDNQKDMDIAKRLTDGCIWAYESTPVGVMAETFNVMPCDSQSSCPWNEKKWHQFLDMGMQERLDAVEAYNKHQEALYGKQTPLGSNHDPSSGKSSKASEMDYSGGKAEASSNDDEIPSKMKSKTKTTKEDASDEEPSLAKLDDLAGLESGPEKPEAKVFKGGISKEYLDRRRQVPEDALDDTDDSHKKPKPDAKEEKPSKASSYKFEDDDEQLTPLSFKPKTAMSHEKFIQATLQENRFPPGYTSIFDRSYKLRPEAIESVFIMWRLTGETYWREQGWKMFEAIQKATRTAAGNAALVDVTSVLETKKDSMESFWLAETLKYFYLLFSEPDLISLDEYVLNTEAHPFKLSK